MTVTKKNKPQWKNLPRSIRSLLKEKELENNGKHLFDNTIKKAANSKQRGSK